MGIGLFLAGFGAGWLVRSGVDSSRGAVVSTIAGLMHARDRVKRAIAMEREHLEDLLAEARTHYASRKRVSDVEVPSRRAVNDRAA